MRLLTGLLLTAGCRPPVAATGQAPEGHLVIAHTNDLHTHFLPERAQWLPGEPEIGGMAAIDTALSALRVANGDDAVLYLDAGDLLSGTPLMEFEVHGARGGAMVDFLDLLKCDAWTVGNHEFDAGFDNAAAFSAASHAAGIPVLSANLDDPASGAPAMPGQVDRLILERNGVRVGVFGLTTPGLQYLASARTMQRLAVQEVAATARAQVAALDGEVDLVVALTHLGVEWDEKLAVDVDGIDLVVGGHSHTAISDPVLVGETWIVQAGSYGRQLGVVELDVVGGELSALSARLVDLDPGLAPPAPSAELAGLVDRYDHQIRERFDQRIGQVGAPLSRDGDGECGLGRWAADVVRDAAGSDVGIYNRGGLRADIAAGPLVRRQLYEVFPFGNRVVRFEMTGAELVGVLLHSVAGEVEGNHSPLQLSGVSLSWRVRDGAPELLDVFVGDERLSLERPYSVATNSFVAEQWQRNLAVDPGPVEALDLTVLEAAEVVAARGPVTPPPESRTRRIDN